MADYSKRMDNISLSSDVGDMLKISTNPEVISFAGGLPSPDTFPVAEIAEITRQVLMEMGGLALQYSTTPGFPQLRQQIAQRMSKLFCQEVSPDEVVITNGSQQGLDLTGRLFLDEGDIVLCESPTYMAALQAFRNYGANFVEMPTDDDGVVVEDVERLLNQYPKTKIIYVIPDFQNPTGKTWSLERRQKFMKLVEGRNIPIIEDNPYGELRFEGKTLPTLKSMDKTGAVIHLGTFSKIYCPGYRIGWMIASPEYIQRYLILKESSDLHTSSINQICISRYMEKFSLDDNIKAIIDLYRKRRDVMLSAMAKEFPAGVTWTHPQGGLFIWVTLPENVNSYAVLDKCLEHNVAFVPGLPFFPCGSHKNHMRINFSNMPEEKIEEGIRRLGKVLRTSFVR